MKLELQWHIDQQDLRNGSEENATWIPAKFRSISRVEPASIIKDTDSVSTKA